MGKAFIHLLAILPLVLTLARTPAALGEELLVQGYYGRYDAAQKVSGFPSRSLRGPVTEPWIAPDPGTPWRIGVLFPHLKDPYWETANYGIVSYARKRNLKITLYTAGAYANFGNQRMQMRNLVARKQVDGILLASVDYTRMDPFVEEACRAGVPVVALINDIYAPAIRSKVMVSFFDMGYLAGRYVLGHSAKRDLRIALLPGPRNAGWAADSVAGFLQAIRQLRAPRQKITLLEPLYGDTRRDVQQIRLDTLSRRENRGLDYIVGNAVAAVAAVDYLHRNREIHPKGQIVSTYITSRVYEQIQEGNILAALSDQSISQCRIALDMVVKILEGQAAGKDFPFRVSPIIPLITRDNIGRFPYETLFGEKDFKPVFDEF